MCRYYVIQSLYYSCQIEHVAIKFLGQFYFYVICFSFLKYFIIKKNWYAYNDREFNKNYLFKIKFTIKFSLSLSLSLSLNIYIYIYIYFNWLSHPIIFNLSFIQKHQSFSPSLVIVKNFRRLGKLQSQNFGPYKIFMMQMVELQTKRVVIEHVTIMLSRSLC